MATCSTCAAANASVRLPRGWKRRGEAEYCKACWRGQFVLRAVTLPVAAPVGVEWPELRERTAKAWGMSTALANWAVAELAKADIVRAPGMAKLPKRPPVYLYGLYKRGYSGRADWVGASHGAIAVLNAVERKYKATRYETVWKRSASLLSFRYPMPFPVDADGWSASWADDGRRSPVVSITLPGGRVVVRLRREASLGRQLAAFGQIVSGAALPCEAAVYRQAKGGNSNRNGVEDREGGGGRRQAFDVMLKLVGWFPRKEPGARVNTMLVRTDPNALLVAEVPEHAPWIMNADHVRRKAAEHRVKLQRAGEDTKAEKRLPAARRRGISELRQTWSRKYGDFMDTFTHTASKQVAEYAARRRCAEVIYDDAVKTYLPAFPWFQLRERLKYKLDERGIKFTGGDSDDADDGSD